MNELDRLEKQCNLMKHEANAAQYLFRIAKLGEDIKRLKEEHESQLKLIAKLKEELEG